LLKDLDLIKKKLMSAANNASGEEKEVLCELFMGTNGEDKEREVVTELSMGTNGERKREKKLFLSWSWGRMVKTNTQIEKRCQILYFRISNFFGLSTTEET
jgi:hypothetical protein